MEVSSFPGLFTPSDSKKDGMQQGEKTYRITGIPLEIALRNIRQRHDGESLYIAI
ncbi:MAG: hypothetical protein N3B21_01115 [Clostridia bacterium]|nr:hypothetical protein [Clostridia bacterium]